MIIDLYNDDFNQQNVQNEFPAKARGFHTQIWPKIQKIEIS